MQGSKNIIRVIVLVLIVGSLLTLFLPVLYHPTKSPASSSVMSKKRLSFVEPSQISNITRNHNPYSGLSPDELEVKASAIMEKADRIMSERKIQSAPLSSAEKEKIKESIDELSRKIEYLSSQLKQ